MIQKTSSRLRIDQAANHSESNARRTQRRDAAAIQLPSPHFNAANGSSVLEYLDIAFKTLNDRSASEARIARTMRQIYGVLHRARAVRNSDDWAKLVRACRSHHIIQTLHEDAFTRRAFEKPRGYAGDAVLLDFIYDSENPRSRPSMTWVGKRIHQCTTNSSACQGVKQRRAFIAEVIDRLARQIPQPEILSVACGHVREAEYSVALRRQRLGRFVAIDSDDQSLQVVDRDYGVYGIETVKTSAREVVTGRFDQHGFDLVYSSGLYDYLNVNAAQRLTRRLFNMVKPGGYLLLTNFVKHIEVNGYMEVFMDWHLVFRNRIEMVELTKAIDEAELVRCSSFTEENRNVIFLLLQRQPDLAYSLPQALPDSSYLEVG